MAGTGRPGVSRNAMPRRQRWTPVKGTGTRVASPAERALLAAADLPLRVLGRAPMLAAPPLAGDRVREVLVLRADRLDLALDLQGDVRAAWLMALTGARERIGYANTGGARLLTRVVPLDETVSWIDQNRRAVAMAAGPEAIGAGAPVDLLTADDRARA